MRFRARAASQLVRLFVSAALFLILISPALHAGSDASEEPIHLRSATIHGPGDTAGLPDALLASPGDLTGGGPALIRLRETGGVAVREAARKAGIRLVAYVGNGAWVAWLPAGGTSAARRLPGFAWAAPYHPGLRIAAGLAAIAADDPRERIALTLHLFPHADVEEVARRIEKLGVAVYGRLQGRSSVPGRADRMGRIVFLSSPTRWVEHRGTIAAWPETLWIDRRPVYRLFNDASAWVGQSGLDAGGATPVYDNGIFGDGQVVGILDTGLDADICYMRDDAHGLPESQSGLGVGTPDPTHRKVLMVNFLWNAESPADPLAWDTHDHGTHVAGSVAGDRTLTPGRRDPGDGMAPAAKLVIQDGGYGVDDCADMPAIGCPAADLYPFFEQAYLQGARIHSNSYGDRENFTPYNIYSDGSEAADSFVRDHPDFLLVFAAGNNGSGADTVASPATGKNVLAVGATNHGASSHSLASFSSRGLTHDGRFKPDVTAPGVDIVSADNDGDVRTDNCGTRGMSGTSMACPTAAGLAALVREYYTKGFYPTGAASPGDAFTPSAALLKATLIASATPMGGVSQSPPSGPQGWGRILLDDALFFPGNARRLWVRDVADRFSSPLDPADSYSIEIFDGSKPLRVVLDWTDYPSNPIAAVNLVNDLDLEVVSPTGSLYRGNVFAAGQSVSGGSPDRLNNVEAVRIENPEAGSWTVRVIPEAIPQPAQGYALVATGRLPAGGVVLERASLEVDDTVGGNGDGILEPGEWIDLPLTLINSGDAPASNISIELTSATPGVSVIQPAATVPDLQPGSQAVTNSPQLRIRLDAGFPCSSDISLLLDYAADGFESSEELTLPSGTRVTLFSEEFEGSTTWQHQAAESNALTGDWTVGDPVGTGFQPENDATPDPGTRCFYTAPNPGAGVGSDDVDDGVVVARSGGYDLAGHPEARLSLKRWFANRDLGEDDGDFYRLEIRQDVLSPDKLLEQIDYQHSEPRWTEVTFRLADHLTPGPAVELKVSAADGSFSGNIIEAAIDDVVFWEPFCEIHDPAPNPVDDLRVDRAPTDVLLSWKRPVFDPAHGEADRYGLYRSESASTGFALVTEVTSTATNVGYTDTGAVTGPAQLFYLVIAGNAAGEAEPAP